MNNVEQLWSTFLEIINRGMKEYIPLVRHFDDNGHKWKRPLIQEIRDEIKAKHSAYNKYKRSCKPDDFQHYKRIRNRVKSLVKIVIDRKNVKLPSHVKLIPRNSGNM